MEIGFNAGHSAELFLKNNPHCTVTSFDICAHYRDVYTAKEYIDVTYPNRHTLLLGDSTVTVPNYSNENINKKFDVVFIDGGHEYFTAKADLENCMNLAHKDTIVIVDDTIFTEEWIHFYNVGPTKAWTEAIQNNKLIELGRREYSSGRGMSWGSYILP
jgi:predicted O-methyltransferase YrrM